MYNYRNRKILITVSVIILTFSMVTALTNRTQKAPTSHQSDKVSKDSISIKPAASPTTRSLHLGEPHVLRIPALKIEAAVQSVGLNAKGEMDTPKDSKTVAWYKYGYIPGSQGNAVIAGHNEYKGDEAVFSRLHKLSKGNIVEVVTSSHIQVFEIRNMQTYDAETFETTIFGPDKEAKLNLITCGGTWNARKKSYSNRLVVSTVFTKEVRR